jgi:hypothetical protein
MDGMELAFDMSSTRACMASACRRLPASLASMLSLREPWFAPATQVRVTLQLIEAANKSPYLGRSLGAQFAQYSAPGNEIAQGIAQRGMAAISSVEALAKARSDAEPSLQLDETSSEAHAARASIRVLYEWDWRGGAGIQPRHRAEPQ